MTTVVSDKRRALTMAELDLKMGKMFGGLMATEAEPWQPRPTDVVIGPFAKCGTTWLQQIFHTLRTRGDTDFDDISRVVPWIETSPGLGIDLNAEQKANPRGYKSHLPQDQIPPGAKYIVSVRDPRDALVSMYKFMEGWFMEPGAISLDEFSRARFLDAGAEAGYWHHLASWWAHKDDDNVLILAYEQMTRDPEAAIRKVAAFCDIALDAELLEITLQNSSLEFMLAHKNKFDDLLMRELSERIADVPSGSDSAKVREGKVGSHARVLSTGVIDELDGLWQASITKDFGFASYEEMISELG